MTGAPTLDPNQQAGLEAAKARVADDGKTIAETQTATLKANNVMPMMLELIDRVNKADPAAFGADGNVRAEMNNILQTYAPDRVNQFANWVSGNKLDPANVADQKAMMKEFFSLVTNAESQLGGRPGAMLTTFFSKAMPSLDLPKTSVQEMLNYALVGTQMARDYAVQSADHYNRSYDQFSQGGTYRPLSEFDQKWDSQPETSPSTYEAAVKLLDKRPASDWTAGLSEAQKYAALRIAHTANPNVSWTPELLGAR